MKRNIKLIFKILTLIIILILAGILLFIFLYTFSKSPRCSLSGGVWRMFSSGCGDSCTYERQTSNNHVLCTMAFQENCDCGPLRCWNNEKRRCELN